MYRYSSHDNRANVGVIPIKRFLMLRLLLATPGGSPRDGGEVERFECPPDDDAFVSKLLSHQELSMRVGANTTDRFDLTGAADALAELECVP